ncbi:MAG TPA: DUF1772 domain-containing protein [Dietzia timorensis]|uniref:DUF1772 domain-containing protein n=1 Tax=Dietzia timorensis TaxID=499555 RepID=A0A921F2B7_9ACTN|nr:DUF1772 domain-containing protein [Dietzia timorensis]HJE89857.1 DUF1772 domain-containing protein [Dietzia timorensis]
MTWLDTLSILIIGFVGSAEFASVALVHPVVRKLPADQQLVVEKGLLRTFGRVMPSGMTAAAALGIAVAIERPSALLIAAAGVLTVALVVTIAGNVPINLRTGRIVGRKAPEGFITMRRRWDAFQLVRGSLQLLGFVLATIGIAVH